MTEAFHPSDLPILDQLRRRGEATVSELADELEVTPTAIRQRLQRLMFQGFVARSDRRQSRGRPTHGYRLTSSGRRKAGENFADLATALWEEVRSIEDRATRDALIEGIAKRLARKYSRSVQGESLAERMASIASLFGERQIPVSVANGATGEHRLAPVLQVLACPYPDLAGDDDSICRMERTLLSELVGSPLELGECTLKGGSCCRFTTVGSGATEGDSAAAS